MPRTPDFKISQDDEYVLVKISTPYIRITSTELMADGCDFTFYCQPYLLKLTLPYEVDGDDERCKATYDPNNNNGVITAFLPKKERGLHFPDLDLTTRLLKIRAVKDMKEVPFGPLIGVVSSVSYENDEDGCESENEDLLQRTTASTTTTTADGGAAASISLSVAPHYGFNNQYSNVLKSLREEMLDVLQIKDPDNTSEAERRRQRLQSESATFDPERYLGDYFGAEEDPIYSEAMQFEPFWSKQWDLWKFKPATSAPTSDGPTPPFTKDDAFAAIGGFSTEEQTVLSSGTTLKNREYLIPPGSAEETSLFLSLADILFAYCYDCRITSGEATVESSNTIANLSSTLSWLDAFRDPGDHPGTVVSHCARRSVIYPYLRYWKLARKVLTDVCKVLLLGRRCVLKCLLHLRSIFEHTDTHYMLNKLFVDDFCVWIQSVREEQLQRFAAHYNNSKNAFEGSGNDKGKSLVGLHLAEIEQWALAQDAAGGDVEEEEVEGECKRDATSGVSTGGSNGGGGEIPAGLLTHQLPTPLDALPSPPLPTPSLNSTVAVAPLPPLPRPLSASSSFLGVGANASTATAATASKEEEEDEASASGVVSLRFMPSMTYVENGVKDLCMSSDRGKEEGKSLCTEPLSMLHTTNTTTADSSSGYDLTVVRANNSSSAVDATVSSRLDAATATAAAAAVDKSGTGPVRVVSRSSDLLKLEAAVVDEEGEVRMPMIQEI